MGGRAQAAAVAPGEVTSVNVALALAGDAEPGVRDLLVVTAGGVSNRVRFAVGQAPDVLEVEPNSTRDKAQKLPALPVVVNGQLLEGDRDFFRFSARAGQVVVCQVEARALHPYLADAVPGWIDPCLTMYDGGGRQLDTVDDFRFHPDPVLVFSVPRDGEYVVEIRDIIYRGRADFVYRLSIGETPFVAGIFPLGGQRGHGSRVSLEGANLPSTTVDVSLPRESRGLVEPWGPLVARTVSVERQHVRSNALPFAGSDLVAVAESEPNDTPATAQRIRPPVVVDGRIDRPGDVDCFAFTATKGQALFMEVQARRLESPLDSILTLFDRSGRWLAENDDTPDPEEGMLTHQADSRLLYTFPKDGDYVLRLREVQGKGGSAYAYRLVVAPPQPDFSLRVTPDNPRAGRGDNAVLTVLVARKYGFSEPVTLEVKKAPGGFTASPAVISKGQDRVALTLAVPPDARPGLVFPVVTGTARIGERTVIHEAVPAEEVIESFNNRHVLPVGELALAVLDAPGPALSIVTPMPSPLEIPAGGQVTLAVRVVRPPDKAGRVGLRGFAAGLAVGVRAEPIAPERDEGVVTLVANEKATVGGRGNLIISGVLFAGRDSFTRTLPAIPICIVAPRPKPTP